MSRISADEERALTWIGEHNVLFPTTGPGSIGLSSAQIRFMNRVLCRIGKYGGRLGRRNSSFADVLHASSMGNWRGADHMGEVIVQLQQNNLLFESGIESPSMDQQSRTSLYFSDMGTSDYEGGEDKFYPHSVTASDPFVYFAREMDERLSDARERLLDYHSTIADLAERVAVDNPDRSAYQEINQQIERVKSAHDFVSDYEWLLGVITGSLGNVLQNNQYSTRIRGAITHPSVGRMIQAADFISTIDSAGRLAVQVRAAAGPVSSSSQNFIDQSSNLLAVLRVACTFLPILGDYYSAMLDGIPGLIAAFRQALDSKIERLNAITPERVSRGTSGRIQRLPGPPARIRCARCMMDVTDPCRRSAA
jgi:hypothetical protein